MALVAGIGSGLFVLLFFAGLLLVVCLFASAHKLGPVIIGVSTAGYVILAVVLLTSPTVSLVPTPDSEELTDKRFAGTIIMMSVLALTALISVVGLCTNLLAKPITAKPL